MDISLRSANESDADSLARIYNHYIANTYITFETEPVSATEMAQRVAEASNASLPWLVAEAPGEIVGYAYAAKWRGRSAYRFSVESTVYLDLRHTGKGIGSQLYTSLVTAIRATSMHSVIGGIALPNDESVKLHERLGFRKVAHFEQVGYKLDRWVDVGYWQLML